MLKNIILMTVLIQLFGCVSTTKVPLTEDSFVMTSTDTEYGYSEAKPVNLGGFLSGTKSKGAHVEYFQSLLGPSGEQVRVRRLGSCCPFEDPSLMLGGGMLDRYELTYEGISEPAVIYVNLYKFEKPMAPVGFALL